MAKRHPWNHAVTWATIDAIARAHGYSVSRMAKLAKLDPTTFNKSKRVGPTGIPRFPNFGTLIDVLDALNLTWADWAEYYFDTELKIKGENNVKR